jgi:5'-3' exonuclease
MAIIVDYSGIQYASLFAQLGFDKVPTPDLIRHYTLNSLRRHRVLFTEQYGEMILAMDDKKSWREEVFPHYKARRRAAKKKDDTIDWNHVMSIMNKIQVELRDVFPYRVVKAPRAEGDDVVAVLARTLPGKHMVVSKDKDVIQLFDDNIAIYRPVAGEIEPRSNDPKRDLQRFILSGDPGDDIPNVLSDDDTFVTPGKRQKALRKTLIEDIVSGAKMMTPEQIVNYKRNKKLIALSEVPDDVQQAIMDAYHAAPQNDRSKLYPYFVEHKLKDLLDRIEDF